MKNLFIEYPKCSTCQKAKKWLDENKIEYVDRNIVTETPTKDELKKWITKSGLDVRKFFNTSGMKYRELNIKEKIKDMFRLNKKESSKIRRNTLKRQKNISKPKEKLLNLRIMQMT